MSLLDCTAVELAAKIKAGEVTAVEAMHTCPYEQVRFSKLAEI